MNKLTERDLMIGNFVYFNCFDGSKIVVHVTGFMDGIVYGDSEKGSHWCNIKKVEPIPISQEILEKNGFEKVNGEYQDVFYCCDGLDLLIDDRLEPCGYTLYGVFELQIKYLHELQHALRLAGIDKEIEL